MSEPRPVEPPLRFYAFLRSTDRNAPTEISRNLAVNVGAALWDYKGNAEVVVPAWAVALNVVRNYANEPNTYFVSKVLLLKLRPKLLDAFWAGVLVNAHPHDLHAMLADPRDEDCDGQ